MDLLSDDSGRNLRGGEMDFGLGETLFLVRLKKAEPFLTIED